jgi:REP element-mobilizing transposase RayT
MARALRLAYAGAVYHVTCRGNARQPIFRDEHDRQAFVSRLGVSVATYQVTLHVYVLMPNHFHLVVETPRANLSEFMRHFNVTYTGYFNRRHGRVGHLYQGRFQAIVVEAETYLTELSRYVHLNPIRVARWRHVPVGEKLRYLRGYSWSSLPGYLTTAKRSAVMEYWLVLAGFGGDHERGRHAYARFIAEGVQDGVSSPWEQLRGQVLLGSEAFVERMRQRVRATRGAVREQPARRVLFKAWEVDALLGVVARVLGKEVRELCSRGGGLERAMVMECLYRYTPARQGEIGRRMGGVDYSWVSRMRRELRQALPRDAAMREQFHELATALGVQGVKGEAGQ